MVVGQFYLSEALAEATGRTVFACADELPFSDYTVLPDGSYEPTGAVTVPEGG